jgi:ComF family protein
LLCGERVTPAERDDLVCRPCAGRWAPLPYPQCSRCGQPIDAVTACRICADWPPGLERVASAVWLDPSARRAVHLLKYEGWKRIAQSLAAPLRPLLAGSLDAVLVPIPLAPARERSRGYNQARQLAEALAELTGQRVAARLRRIRETATQTKLTPEQRAANLRGAFRAEPGPSVAAVLVDDVFTTGATLVSAASALLEAGVPRVTAVTFARAERPLMEAVRGTTLGRRA